MLASLNRQVNTNIVQQLKISTSLFVRSFAKSKKTSPIQKVTQHHVGFNHKQRFSVVNNTLKKISAHQVSGKSYWKEMTQTLFLYILPVNYPQSVDKSYLSFTLWSNTSVFLGSLKGVITTQSLLYALGLGSGAVYASAALNWILKDGIGQLGGLLFAGLISRRMDGDPQKWNIFSNIVLCLSSLLELLTPYFPGMFVALGAIANIGKNISCIAASASRSSLLRSLCPPPHLPLGDLTAKAGSQAIAASLFGTFLGIGISLLINNNNFWIWNTFLVCCALNIYSTYRSVQHLPLSSLNIYRALYASQPIQPLYTQYINHQLKDDDMYIPVLSPREVASIYPKDILHMNMDIPLRYDRKISQVYNSYDCIFKQTLNEIYDEMKMKGEYYFIICRQKEIDVFIDIQAKPKDELKSFLHSYFLKCRLLNKKQSVTKEFYSQMYNESYTDMCKYIDVYYDSLQKNGWELEEIYIDEQFRRIEFE